jgi:hypothetical protein
VACAELSEALRRNFALTKLDLQGNKIGDDGAAALAEVCFLLFYPSFSSSFSSFSSIVFVFVFILFYFIFILFII